MTQDTKDRILEWVFSQGTSTVLLVAILSFMAYEKTTLEPARSAKIAEETQAASQEIADRMSATSLAIADKHATAIERIIDANDRERALYISMLNLRLDALDDNRNRTADETELP